MEKYGKAPSFAADKVTETRLLKHIRLHHGFDYLLVLILDHKPLEGFFPKGDWFEIIDFY